MYKKELTELVSRLDDGSVFYKKLWANIIQNNLSEAEAEHFILRILHRNQSRKNKMRMAKHLNNL